jgi:hypothetical protein
LASRIARGILPDYVAGKALVTAPEKIVEIQATAGEAGLQIEMIAVPTGIPFARKLS